MWWIYPAYIALAAAIIFLSYKLGDYVDLLDKKTKISGAFIGGIVLAAVTSLPELFTSVTAAMKKNSDIAVGNIVGSNIFNILVVIGLSGMIIPVPFQSAFRFDAIVSTIAVILLLLFCLPKKRLSRLGGIIFLIGYAFYFYKIWYNLKI